MFDLVVGIVLFHPNLEKLEKNIKQFSSANRIVVFDNGSDDETKQILGQRHVDIIGSGENVGIATALNQIMEYARDVAHCEWVVVSDQDAEYSQNLLSSFVPHFDDPDIGIICPTVIKIDMDGNKRVSSQYMDHFISRAPTSGMAMSVSCWESVGKYNDKYFIDYVDYDICQKVIENGLHILRIGDVFLFQSLGNNHRVQWLYTLGKWLKIQKLMNAADTFNHSPFRNYYFVRNGIAYIREHKNSIAVANELKFIIKWELKKLLFEKRKSQQFKAMVRGIWDGVHFPLS